MGNAAVQIGEEPGGLPCVVLTEVTYFMKIVIWIVAIIFIIGLLVVTGVLKLIF